MRAAIAFYSACRVRQLPWLLRTTEPRYLRIQRVYLPVLAKTNLVRGVDVYCYPSCMLHSLDRHCCASHPIPPVLQTQAGRKLSMRISFRTERTPSITAARYSPSYMLSPSHRLFLRFYKPLPRPVSPPWWGLLYAETGKPIQTDLCTRTRLHGTQGALGAACIRAGRAFEHLSASRTLGIRWLQSSALSVGARSSSGEVSV
ncbi:hypothetical protein F4780DRAFT_71921 [Xylariomycetidae sp. FL0641]|nr:hypothetical protein F4780DRAFT_71921 [Xylariomycetidae sp. FL0641]